MFALAILDTHERTLLLARDCFGIKPLYYTRWDGGLAFASEIKALLTLPNVSARANPQRVYDYLRFGQTDHGSETMFAGISQLRSAHYMLIDLDSPTAGEPKRYWSIDTQPREISFPEAASQLREMFLQNVELHLRSDVPLGVALSGGIDSSSIVTAMRHIQPSATIHAFSYVADGPLGEERWIDSAARAANVELHKVFLEPEQLLGDMEELIAIQDEPFGSTSIYPQLCVFRLARQTGIKVVLDGQGADELLAGYWPYVSARAASLIRQGRPLEALRLCGRCSSLPGAARTKTLARTIGLMLPGGIERLLRPIVGEGLRPGWLNWPWFKRAGAADHSAWRARGRDVLRNRLKESVTDNGLPALLRHEDRNSMACSVESRVPFLTPALAEFVLSLPEEYLLAGDGTRKSVFREAMRGLVPAEILARQDKIGFATPQQSWFTTLRPWVEDVLTSDAARQLPPLRIDAVKRQWTRLCAGRRADDLMIWRCLNFISWARRFNVCFDAQ